MTCYFQIKRCLSRRWQAGVVSCILVGQSEIRFRLGINFNSEEIIWDCCWNNLGHFHVGNQFQFRRDNLGLFLKWCETFSDWKLMDGVTKISLKIYQSSHPICTLKIARFFICLENERGKRWTTVVLLFQSLQCIASMPTARSCCYWGAGESEKLEERISKDPHFLLRSLVSALDP